MMAGVCSARRTGGCDGRGPTTCTLLAHSRSTPPLLPLAHSTTHRREDGTAARSVGAAQTRTLSSGCAPSAAAAGGSHGSGQRAHGSVAVLDWRRRTSNSPALL